ncbi:MAG: 7-carboxy-7-deazaguanine synthase QueE, partial [Planctomycetota bacterium]
MRIAELFESVQGEGELTGTPSVFIRTSGCNLRCHFCDTPYTSWEPEGESHTVEQLVDQVQATACRHVVITGGEPMLFGEMSEFTRRLATLGVHITIESAGTIDQPVRCDLMSISPKRPNSTPSVQQAGGWSARHEQTRHNPRVMRRLLQDYEYQLKFVVAAASDIDDVFEY